jgi:ACT domain-containing protein
MPACNLLENGTTKAVGQSNFRLNIARSTSYMYKELETPFHDILCNVMNCH